jgi:hypothetical protein
VQYAQAAKDGRVRRTEMQARRRLLERKIEIVGFGAAKTCRQACTPQSFEPLAFLSMPNISLAGTQALGPMIIPRRGH